MANITRDIRDLQARLGDRARTINKETSIINIHDHLMFEFMIRKDQGQKRVFDTCYAPMLRQGNINVIATSVGANSPCLCNLTDHLLYGCFQQIDALYEEQEQSDSFRICTDLAEIEEVTGQGKIAVLLAFEGARALEGKVGEENLSLLRIFHRLGLRVNCLVGGGRTAFASGMGDKRANAGLSTFGIKLVEEMNRIGMLIDLTHMTRRSFFHALEVSRRPVVVSHTGVKAICDNPNSMSDEMIEAIGRNRGVIGLEMLKHSMKHKSHETGEYVDYSQTVKHIRYIADRIGIDHVGLGLDFDNFDLIHNIHRAMCPAPGSIEGFYTGVPKGDHMIDEPNNPSEAFIITQYLVDAGFSDIEIKKILRDNIKRLLRETLS